MPGQNLQLRDGRSTGVTGGRVVGPNQWHPPGTPEDPRSGVNGWGRGPLTDPLVAASMPGALFPNRIGVQPWTSSNGATLAITVDRPSILWPLRQPLGYLRYSSEKQSPITNESVPNLGGTIVVPIGNVQYSFGTGCCFLSNPGTWYVQYVSTALGAMLAADTATLECIVVDAFNGGVLTRVMNEGGCGVVGLGSIGGTPSVTDALVSAAGAVSNIADQNRYRRAMMLQLVNATSCRVGLGWDPVAVAAIPNSASRGLRLGNASTAIVLQGDFCWRGDVRACTELTGGAATTIVVTEWSL